jgi:hypothetical protein
MPRTKAHRSRHVTRPISAAEGAFFPKSNAAASGKHRMPALTGKGPAGTVTHFGDVAPVQLRGRTSADFSNNQWSLINERGERGAGCNGCGGAACVAYSATLHSTFQVTTVVTLPNVSDYSGYSECQQQRIQDAINNVLTPHEQEHVAAFNTYNGSVDTPISATGCRSTLPGQVQRLAETGHLTVERPRRAAAQATSDALDPFVVNVDLNCT